MTGRPGPSRIVTGVLACTAALLLSGCTLEGSINVLPDALTVDLVFVERVVTPTPGDTLSSYCQTELPPGISREVQPAPPGHRACRMQGLMTHIDVMGMVRTSNGHTSFTLPAAAGDSYPDPLERLDLTITMPGEIVAASVPGAHGSTLHLTDPDQMSTPVLVLSRADGFDGKWVAPLVGVPLAALLGGVAFWVGFRRRSTRRRRSPDDQERSAAPASEAEPAKPDASPAPKPPPQDPSVWAPD